MAERRDPLLALKLGRLASLGAGAHVVRAWEYTLPTPSHVAKRPKYESLVAWQRADDLFVRLHRITKQRFPADEPTTCMLRVRLGYLTEDLYAELVLDIRKVGAPLTGRIRAVRASLASKRILPIAER